MNTTLKHDVRPDMRKNNNTIEINGQLYDARTGDLIKAADLPAAAGQSKPVRRVAIHSVKHVPQAARHPAKRSAAHTPDRPRTLMRHTVKKPEAGLKRRHKAQGEINALTPPLLSEVALKASASRLDEKRLNHAKQIRRSRLIRHFPLLTTSMVSHGEPPISLPKRPARPGASHTPATKAQRPGRPAATTDFLDRAVERSTSHLQPPPKHRHGRLKRRASMGAAVVLSVLVLGFIVAQNANGVRLQMASAKAGFDASLPDRPAGFALGQLNYGPGVVAEQFRGGGHHYTVIQRKSSWDNQALLNNFVAADYQNYQTVATAGHTIYLYGNHDATWVNDGVWYVVQSDGSLSNQQLIDLALSLS